VTEWSFIADEQVLPDVIAGGLRVLFCGINPGMYSAATGHHFARPGNRFWPALFQSGFTPRLLAPSEQELLLSFGLGLTNVVSRASAKAAELSAAELVEGASRLRRLCESFEPTFIALLGVTAYRTAFNRSEARLGEQSERLGPSRIWVLPNPSGLNAHFTLGSIADAFAELRAALDGVAT
jgi:TDG/mug DNA glycosylase family protein